VSDKHYLDTLAAYCLDALDPAEREEIASHLARCSECRNEALSVADCLHTTFGQDCPEAMPEPALRTQFMARVAMEMRPAPEQSAAFGALPAVPVVEAPVRPRARFMGGAAAASRRWPPVRWLIAAAVAVPTVFAALFANAWVHMNHQYADVQSRYTTQQSHMLEQALVSPHKAMPLKGPATSQGMTGEVIVPSNSSGGLIILSGLSNPPTHMGYTCWILRDGQWTFYGPLKQDVSHLAMFVMDNSMDPHGATMLEITLERMDRSLSAPSAPMLLSTPL
jgi:hypothetical protein